jgi:hypothetical protein
MLEVGGDITATGNISAYYSDKRLKENIIQIDNPLLKLNKLKGIYYNQNKLAEQYGFTQYERQVGVLAQDVEEVLPEAVSIAPFDNDGNGNSKSGERYLTVKYEKIVPLLIECIKQLQLEIKELKKSSAYIKENTAWFLSKQDTRWELSNMAGGLRIYWPVERFCFLMTGQATTMLILLVLEVNILRRVNV